MKKKDFSKESVASYSFIIRKFKDPYELGSPTYNAHYTSEKNFSISGNIIDLKNGTWEEFKGKDAWDLFYKYATFAEILTPFPSLYFYCRNNRAVMPKAPDDLSFKTEEELKKFEFEYNKQLLMAIRDDPELLSCAGRSYNHVTDTLIRILEVARWSSNKKEADEATDLLKYYLIPTRTGGKVPLPSNMEDIKELLISLALHLSEKCKKSSTYLREEKQLDEGLYKEIIACAKNNRELRICHLSQKELTHLIFKPSSYAQNLLARHFKTSTKTITRNK